MLGTRTGTPMHYGALHPPPVYVETTDPVGRLRVAGRSLGLTIEVCEPGDWFEVRRAPSSRWLPQMQERGVDTAP